MKASNLRIWVSILIVCAFLAGRNVYAQNGITFQAVSTKIVTTVEGVNGQSVTWENAESAKGLIVKVKVTVPKDTTLWDTDFDIAYHHKNSIEDRGMCRAITTLVSSPGDDGAWIVGNYSHVTAKEGTRYFKLLFPIENDVTSFSLQFTHQVVKEISVNRD